MTNSSLQSLAQSHSASKKGNIKRSKYLGNVALTLTVVALVFGLVILFIAALNVVLFFVRISYCGVTVPYNPQHICNRVF